MDIAYVVEMDLLNGRDLRVRVNPKTSSSAPSLQSVRVLSSIASTTHENQVLLRHIHRLAIILTMSCVGRAFIYVLSRRESDLNTVMVVKREPQTLLPRLLISTLDGLEVLQNPRQDICDDS